MGAVYTGAIELRRLVIRWSRTPSGGISEDTDAVSIHFAKLTGGAVDSNWLTADYTAVEARFDTWWTSLKVYMPTTTKLVEYRWYKDGPVWAPDDLANGPANPATRITARSVAATGTGVLLPPQVAMSVTKIVPIRKRWGRIFLPAMVSTVLDSDGRFTNNGTVLGFCVTAFNGCRTDGKQPVVWSRGRSAYVTPKGNSIAAHAASAYEIDQLQVDNLPDVVRSRRYDAPTVRSLTTLT